MQALCTENLIKHYQNLNSFIASWYVMYRPGVQVTKGNQNQTRNVLRRPIRKMLRLLRTVRELIKAHRRNWLTLLNPNTCIWNLVSE